MASLIPKKSDRFAKSAYKDVWATILWLLFLCGFFGISFQTIKNLNFKTPNPSNGESPLPSFSKHLFGFLLTSAMTAFVLSLAYFMALKRYAGKMITGSLWVSIGLNFVIAVLMLVNYFRSKLAGHAIGAGVFFLLGFIWIWAYSAWKVRVPFARIALKTVLNVMSKYPALLGVAIVGLIIQTLFACYSAVSLVGLAQLYTTEGISDSVAAFLAIYMLFTFYWTTQIIKNAVHITVAGLFATFYFLGVTQPDGTVDVPVLNPTAASLKRAMTTSLGPNCYGSLLISAIALVRILLRYARKTADEDGNVACVIFLCCIECLLSMIESMLAYFNKYAFTQVAIYGKDFCTAGKDTWELIKSRGIDAIINDDLIANVLNLGGVAIGLLTALGGYLFVHFSSMPNANEYYVAVCLVSFFVGIAEFSILSVVIDSGVATTFVCLAEDPLALEQKQPDLYQQIQRSYPAVVFL